MKVFLSHSTLDKPVVRRVKAALAPHGPDLWFDEFELFPGDSLFGKIQTAISDSDCVLAFISENSVRSAWVNDELNSFLAREKTTSRPLVIPVILDNSPPPAFLAHRLQVRTLGKSLGSVIQELLKGILRSHGVLRVCPLSSAPFRLEPFSMEVDRLKTHAIQGMLHTVFDAFELADILVDAMEDATDDFADTVKAALPRSFDTLSAISPKAIQVVFSLEPSAGGPGQVERLIQLVWRIVTLTFIDFLTRYGDRSKIQRHKPYDLPSAVVECETVIGSHLHYNPGFGIRPAVWLRHHQTTLAECQDFAFIGNQREDGIRVWNAPHIFIPSRYLRPNPNRTWVPELDFLPYQWLTGVLPLIIANAVVNTGFTGIDTAEAVAGVGLRPEDYRHYGLS